MKIKSFFLFIILFYSCSAQDLYKTSWEKDGWIFATGSALSITGLILKGNTDPLSTQEIAGLSREDINWLDKGAIYNWDEKVSDISDWLVTATIVSPLTLFLSKDIRKDFQTVGIMYLETLLLTSSIRSITKGFISRNRPYVYYPDAPMEKKLDVEAKRSFFSGHTATAFSTTLFMASVYSEYYPRSKYKSYIWGGAILFSSLVGYYRYEAGKHYPTDILTGAIIGSTVGLLIPYIHKNDIKESTVQVISNNRMQPQLVINFIF